MYTLWHVPRAPGRVGPLRSLRRVIAVLGIGGLFVLSLMASIIEAQEKQISCKAWRQMQVVLNEKAARTPAQRKISSRLLESLRRQQGKTVQPKIPDSRSREKILPDGTILVDIKANVTDSLLQHIKTLGGTIVNSFPQYQAIRAQVPAAQLETLAESPDVKSIKPAEKFQLHR